MGIPISRGCRENGNVEALGGEGECCGGGGRSGGGGGRCGREICAAGAGHEVLPKKQANPGLGGPPGFLRQISQSLRDKRPS